ncbi:DUF1444 family protein [Bacillus lacus]|uniref:UPF0354 protein GJU40_11205 n=1 Tax=Metabacillus lacus TaxID=1983721 RepID=A0A7X2IZU5_9BACI|nr:DUF1444 family protein [Metabacillus lacus]
MKSKEMADTIIKKLKEHPWLTNFDKEKDTLRIEESSTGKGMTISLPGIIARWENEGDKAVEEVVYYIQETFAAMGREAVFSGSEKGIFPVIRSTSFPSESSDGVPLVTSSHTAETRIYYALDLGKTYQLIDENMLNAEGWNKEQVREAALFNLRSLKHSAKADSVAGNVFYFFNSNDGYDASRILDERILKSYQEKAEGTLAVAVPHQDVLILADIRNETGYDVLAQMAMSFFAGGRVPITALSFLYEDEELEPVFILGKNRPLPDKKG